MATKTSLTLPETFADSGGRAAYSSLETAANLAQSIELVAGVQEGGGTLSTDAQLAAQNLRESVAQSGQTVSADQVSTQQTTSAPATEQGGSTASESSPSTKSDQTVATDPVAEETARQHQQDPKEALNDVLQGRTVEQINADQDKSRVALDEAEKKLDGANRVTRQIIPKPSEQEIRDALKTKAEALKIIKEQKAIQKELDRLEGILGQYIKDREDKVIAAYEAQIERKKKKIAEDATLTPAEITAAHRALDRKLADIKSHPQAYMEALGYDIKSAAIK